MYYLCRRILSTSTTNAPSHFQYQLPIQFESERVEILELGVLVEEIMHNLEFVSSSLDAPLQTASKVSASSEFQDVNSCSFDKDLKQNRSAKRDGRQMAGAVVP